MFFPLIFWFDETAYEEVTGFNEHVYLKNWLAVTGALFAGSGITYLRRLGVARRRARRQVL